MITWKANRMVKIHNLPDHVYFNHSQHVKVGKQQCQTCHGPIPGNATGIQFCGLSMGCVSIATGKSKVNFYNKKPAKEINFYSIYEKFIMILRREKWIV